MYQHVLSEHVRDHAAGSTVSRRAARHAMGSVGRWLESRPVALAPQRSVRSPSRRSGRGARMAYCDARPVDFGVRRASAGVLMVARYVRVCAKWTHVMGEDIRSSLPRVVPWGRVLHDDDMAHAIVDRILERGRLLTLNGPSLRTRHLGLDDPTAAPHSDVARVSGIRAPDFSEPTAATRDC